MLQIVFISHQLSGSWSDFAYDVYLIMFTARLFFTFLYILMCCIPVRIITLITVVVCETLVVKTLLIMLCRLSIICANLVSAPYTSFTWCFAAYCRVLFNARI